MNDQPTRAIDPRTRTHQTDDDLTRDDDHSTRLAQPQSDGTQGATGELIGGRYRLLDLLGEGGMGSVWRAEQLEPVRRVVAVKLIKAGMDSKAVLARFDAERQALAVMDHPNIAKVLDGGATPNGHPYFVMEYVSGQPITTYADARRLTVHNRLELFVTVCQAIQHAHQKGIIHRDIKPGNVLVTEVDGKPAAKVIDFGIAKAAGGALTDLTLNTGLGAIMGTPEYMSPEQADPTATDIDTRSDVYSLGVLLYEMLTGSPPFSRKTLANKKLFELLRLVREVDPPRPSEKLGTSDDVAAVAGARGSDGATLSKQLRREVDWVVMKALEKDRNRRYDTPAELAADVGRSLAGEAVSAVPPTLGYRVRKWVKKNRAAVLVATVVAVALLGAGIGGGVGLVESGKRKEADELRAQAEQAKGEAERAKGQVEDARREMNLYRIRVECSRDIEEFEKTFEYVKQSHRWGHDDELNQYEHLAFTAMSLRRLRDPSLDPDPFNQWQQQSIKHHWSFMNWDAIEGDWNWELRYLRNVLRAKRPDQFPRDHHPQTTLRSKCVQLTRREGIPFEETPRPRFSADSKRMAYLTPDGDVAVCDVADGGERAVLPARVSPVRDLVIFRKGDFVATAHQDRQVRIWNVKSGEQVSSHMFDHPPVRFGCRRDELLVVLTYDDAEERVQVWGWVDPTAAGGPTRVEHPEIRSPIRLVKSDAGGEAVLFTTDDTWIEANSGKTVLHVGEYGRLWRVAEKVSLREKRCYRTDPIDLDHSNLLYFSPLLLAVERNPPERSWPARIDISKLNRPKLLDAALLGSGDRLVTVNDDGSLSVWRFYQLLHVGPAKTENGTTESYRDFAAPFTTLPAPGARRVVVSPDYGTVCTVHDDGTVKLWNGRQRTDNPLLP